MKNNLLIVAVLALVVILVAALMWNPGEMPKHQALSLQEGPAGGDFKLKSAQGSAALKDYQGKVVLLYFGYTWCPDICPTSLALLSSALEGFSEQELKKIQAIFVSVDPERDTVERLATYTAFFHPSILGATGTPEEIAEVATKYGVAYRKVESDSATGYIVDHSSVTYVINKQGGLHKVLMHGTLPSEIQKAVREIL